jgi:hypothetical protein
METERNSPEVSMVNCVKITREKIISLYENGSFSAFIDLMKAHHV